MVASSHTGELSLPLFVTSTLNTASAGIRPPTVMAQSVIWASASIGCASVMLAAVTAFVKVKVLVTVALPSVTVTVRV